MSRLEKIRVLAELSVAIEEHSKNWHNWKAIAGEEEYLGYRTDSSNYAETLIKYYNEIKDQLEKENTSKGA